MRHTIIYVIVILLTLCGCSNKYRYIEEKEFKAILSETLLTDAYLSVMRNEYGRDSIRFFEPILSKYGYDLADFEYTITKMAHRKSNVFPTLVSEVLEGFEIEKQNYNYRSELMDMWAKRADSLTKETVFFRDSLKIRSKDSLGKMVYNFDVKRNGDYEIYLKYKIDSLDKNKNHIMFFTLTDTLNRNREISRSSWLNKGVKGGVARQTINADAWRYNRLTVDIVNVSKYGGIIEKPYIDIDSVRIVFHYPKSEAVKMFRDSILGNKLGELIDKIYTDYEKKDSSALHDFGGRDLEKRDSVGK